MSRMLLAVLVGGLVSASAASAQIPGPAGKMVQFGLGGGVSVPVGDAQDALKEGFHVRGFMKVIAAVEEEAHRATRATRARPETGRARGR